MTMYEGHVPLFLGRFNPSPITKKNLATYVRHPALYNPKQKYRVNPIHSRVLHQKGHTLSCNASTIRHMQD